MDAITCRVCITSSLEKTSLFSSVSLQSKKKTQEDQNSKVIFNGFANRKTSEFSQNHLWLEVASATATASLCCRFSTSLEETGACCKLSCGCVSMKRTTAALVHGNDQLPLLTSEKQKIKTKNKTACGENEASVETTVGDITYALSFWRLGNGK